MYGMKMINKEMNMSRRYEMLLKAREEMNDPSVWGSLNYKNWLIELCGNKFNVDLILLTKFYGYHSKYPQICVAIYLDQNPPQVVAFVKDPVERQNIVETIREWLYEEID